MERKDIPIPLRGKSSNKPKTQQSKDATKYPQGYFKNKPCKLCSTMFKPHAPAEHYCSDTCKDDALSNAYLMRQYQITLEDYRDMYEEQNGLCKICGEDGTRRASATQSTPLVIDHSHVTGDVRGLLCHTCNSALGQFNDDIGILNKAIEYLTTSKVSSKHESTSIVRVHNDNIGQDTILSILEDNKDNGLNRKELMSKYSISESRIRSIIELKTEHSRKAYKRYLKLKEQSATTIPNGSTSQVNGDGSGSPLTDNAEGDDIVSSI